MVVYHRWWWGRSSPLDLRVDVEDTGEVETIEAGGGGHSISPHLLIVQPITNRQLRQLSILSDDIEGVTGGSPYTGLEDWAQIILICWGERGRGEERRYEDHHHFIWR